MQKHKQYPCYWLSSLPLVGHPFDSEVSDAALSLGPTPFPFGPACLGKAMVHKDFQNSLWCQLMCARPGTVSVRELAMRTAVKMKIQQPPLSMLNIDSPLNVGMTGCTWPNSEPADVQAGPVLAPKTAVMCCTQMFNGNPGRAFGFFICITLVVLSDVMACCKQMESGRVRRRWGFCKRRAGLELRPSAACARPCTTLEAPHSRPDLRPAGCSWQASCLCGCPIPCPSGVALPRHCLPQLRHFCFAWPISLDLSGRTLVAKHDIS